MPSTPRIEPTLRAPRKKGITGLKLDLVFSIALFFFLWGLFIFYAVGVGRPPAWRYGIVPDVPGQSVYSVQGAERTVRYRPCWKGKQFVEQHIMGGREETGKPQGKKGL